MLLKKKVPFSGERESEIGAVTGANGSERVIAPKDDGSKHGINLPLEIWGPPSRRVGAEVGLDVEGGVERRVRTDLEP